MPLPSDIENKQAIINVKNNDNKCFAYSILCNLYPASDHVDRVNNYENNLNKLNFDNLPFPMELNNIPKFEKQNIDISVNVFGLKKKVSKKEERRKKINTFS